MLVCFAAHLPAGFELVAGSDVVEIAHSRSRIKSFTVGDVASRFHDANREGGRGGVVTATERRLCFGWSWKVETMRCRDGSS